MSCEQGCYEKQIIACEDIIIAAGLEANQPYFAILTNPGKGTRYQFQVQANEEGKVTISASSMGAGALTAGNFFQLELRSGSNYLEKVTMTFDSVQYGCAMIELVDFVLQDYDDSPVNVLS